MSADHHSAADANGPRATGGRRVFSSALQRNSFVALVFILLTALGTWTYLGVRNSLRDLQAEALQTVLDAEVKALEVWIGERKADPRRWADEDFANILGTARMGTGGEAYTFDRSGLMLSQSPFARDLQRAGVLPRLQVRDPGGDLLQGHQPALAPPERPLTRMAAAAIGSIGNTDPARQHGLVLDPYRNYRGAEVIGAWRWLPKYEMAIAVEASAAESYAPLRYLDAAFAAVLGLTLLAAGTAVLVSVYQAGPGRRDGKLREIGHYVLIREVGEGGMSTVYFARHALMMRPTAVKVMKPHVASDEMIARFQREVRQTARLTHPNTIRIFDYGRGRDGSFFYAMEFLDGISLDQLVARDGRVPAPRVIHVLRGVCGSLREAHAKGLIHRDIKPPNVMLCEQGGEHDMVKVLDFGLVKDLDRPDSRDITKSLRVLGTPLYMAPERIRNAGSADPRTDVYSLGAVAFNMLTGERLFESGNDLDLAEKVLNAPPRRPSECAREVPAELDDLVLACLAKDPQQRPAGMDELQNALDRLAQRHPWTQDDAARWWARYRASDVKRET